MSQNIQSKYFAVLKLHITLQITEFSESFYYNAVIFMITVCFNLKLNMENKNSAKKSGDETAA